MTDQELRDLAANLTRDVKKLQESQAKTEAQMAETDRKLRSVGIQLGNIGNNQGDVAEEFFYNSLADKKTLAGINYDYVGKNWKHDMNKIRDEFDIVMVNGKDVAIIETKYKAHISDVEKLITKKKENFRALYPAYQDYNLHLAIASFNINDDAKQEALTNNVIVLQRKGDVMEVFEPIN